MKTLETKPVESGPSQATRRPKGASCAAAPGSAALLISPRTGRAVRKYDDSISTTVKALDFDERAIRKLVTKWPEGAPCGPGKLEPWHRHLAVILVQVLEECGPIDPLLTYTPPNLRGLPNEAVQFPAR